MILIAHRGLTHGPDPLKENHPRQISLCIAAGFDVEIDVWFKDGDFWLGHDQPQYPITREFFSNPGLWIHAKNYDAAFELSELSTNVQSLNFFWHENDQRVLTSQGFWWTFPGQTLCKNSIAVMPEWHVSDLNCWAKQQTCAGICSDFVGTITR